MSEKNRNKIINLSDFLRYKKNKMTGRERNAFERSLQKDPFAAEAAEGLGKTGHQEIMQDMKELQSRLHAKTSRSKRRIYYGAAAAVILLLISAPLFFLINKKIQSPQVTETAAAPPDGKTGIPVTAEEPADSIISTAVALNIQPPVKKQTSVEAEQPKQAEPSKDEMIKVAEEDKKAEMMEVVTTEKEIAAAGRLAAERAAVTDRAEHLMPALSKSAAPQSRKIKGRIISSEDGQPIPGVTINIKGSEKGTITDTGGNFSLDRDIGDKTLIASFVGMEPKEFRATADSSIEIKMDPSLLSLEEVVVVGYGVSNKAVEEEYTAPKPSAGKRMYDEYISGNIIIPGTMKPGEKVVVVVNFIVTSDGTIDSIRIIKSPGTEYSNEAIRLIKEGPAWIPASEGGKAVDGEVRLRILFRSRQENIE